MAIDVCKRVFGVNVAVHLESIDAQHVSFTQGPISERGKESISYGFKYFRM